MDNLGRLTRDIALDEVPYHEALARLYELRDRYDAATASGLVGSASRLHYDALGHRLAFGCCADLERAIAKSEQEERALLAAVEAEVGYPRRRG